MAELSSFNRDGIGCKQAGSLREELALIPAVSGKVSASRIPDMYFLYVCLFRDKSRGRYTKYDLRIGLGLNFLCLHTPTTCRSKGSFWQAMEVRPQKGLSSAVKHKLMHPKMIQKVSTLRWTVDRVTPFSWFVWNLTLKVLCPKDDFNPIQSRTTCPPNRIIRASWLGSCLHLFCTPSRGDREKSSYKQVLSKPRQSVRNLIITLSPK